jgi:hypothetical protein
MSPRSGLRLFLSYVLSITCSTLNKISYAICKLISFKLEKTRDTAVLSVVLLLGGASAENSRDLGVCCMLNRELRA